LQLSANELDIDQLPITALSDKVKLHVNMLTSVMMHRVFHQSNGGLVVHLELGSEYRSSDELSQQPCQPDCLARSRSGCDILRLTGRQSNNLLFCRLPSNRPSIQEEDETIGALSSLTSPAKSLSE
jgi:hypothetical protein